MTRFRKFAAVAAVCFALAAAAPRPSLALNVDVSTFVLKNGMQVVVVPDHRAPVVTHMVWYKAGSADEPLGASGIAHFLEHLMFKGTHKNPRGTFNRIIHQIGGDDNAFTTKDYTAYYQRVSKDKLGLMMDLEADRMQNLILTDEEVLPERQVIIEERRQRTDNEPSSLLSEQMDASLYLAHPYHKPTIGWQSEMETLSKDDAIQFYKSHYTPSNAVLVVAGDVTAEEVRTLAEEHYGNLLNTVEITPRKRTAEPEPIAARRVTLKDARVAAPMIQRDYLVPSASTAKDREADALDLLSEILGGGSSSRLYKALVVNAKVAAYAGAWYSANSLDSGEFGVYAAPNPGGDVTAVEAAVDTEIARVVKDGVTEQELARAKAKLAADAAYAIDSQVTLARIFGVALTTGQTVDDVQNWQANMEQVTASDVRAVAEKYLDIRRSVTGTLLPEGGGTGTGEQPAMPQIPGTTVN